MGQQELAKLTREAKDTVKVAYGIIAAAMVDPGPAAGPRVHGAVALLVGASQLLTSAAGETSVSRQELIDLANSAAARGGEAAAVAFIPWPFVYAGIAALMNAVAVLRDSIPNIVPLEAALRKDASSSVAAPSHEQVQALVRLGLPPELLSGAFAHAAAIPPPTPVVA